MKSRFVPLIALLWLALAALACTLGAEPTMMPTLFPTATTFIIFTAVPETATTAPTPLPTFQPTAIPCNRRIDWLAYIVQAGDTIGTLATRTNSTIAVLAAANCLANANRIDVGQVIYLPRLPGTAVPVPTKTNTPGGVLPGVQSVLVQPATVQSGKYQVAAGNVTVVAQGVVNATSVTFYLAPTVGSVQPTIIGKDNNLADGASIIWNVPDQPLSVTIWAVATSSTNQNSQSLPITVVHTTLSLPPTIGILVLTPSNLDPATGFYKITPGAVLLSATGVQNASTVSFYYKPQNSTSINLIGSDSNLADGAAITWSVPTGVRGDLYAQAINAAGDNVTSASVSVVDATASGSQ